MALKAEFVSVLFGGLHALEDVSLSVEPAFATGLIGPNGAGKSTLVNVLSGFVKPTTGRVIVDDLDVTSVGPEGRVPAGIARSFQTPRFDPSATVSETLAVSLYTRTRTRLLSTVLATPRWRREQREIAETVSELLERFELNESGNTLTGDLPLWQLRVLEVARVTAIQSKYVLLDEPAAGLDPDERRLLARHIERLVASGVGVLLIDHDFLFVSDVCRRIFVLDQGRTLAEDTPENIRQNKEVIAAYLGSLDDADHV